MPTTALRLALPLILGVLAGAWGVTGRDPEAAVDALNGYVLRFAFPALVVVHLAEGGEALTHAPAIVGAVTVAVLLAVAPLRLVGGDRGGTLALVTTFGNVAYLGLPVTEALLGTDALATAGIAIGTFVFLSLTLGPTLLVAWSPGEGTGGPPWRKLLTQPLLWAPVLGAGLQLGPAGLRTPIVSVLGPLGAAAGPTALFLLGLYLHTHRGRLTSLGAPVAGHLAAKMLWLPVVAFGVTRAMDAAGWLPWDTGRVVWVLSTMPPAITTFSLARDLRRDEGLVAGAIVAGTGLCAVSVPVVGWLLR